jgi:hypothetical protein
MMEKLLDGRRCPRCKRTRFHAVQNGSEIVLKCEAAKECGWSVVTEVKVK